MDAPILPAVRTPVVNGEYTGPDGAVLEISPINKFSVSWPSDAYPIASTPPPSERPSLSSSEESETSDGDSGNEHDLPSHQQDTGTPPTAHVKTQLPVETLKSEPIPRFSRALSMPLPSQLGYLRNPHKSDSATTRPPLPKSVTTLDSSRLRELSVELADSVQMMIQTMLQVSPPQLLDPAKEQFSACALSVPASSVSAMFATMKNLNFISANMANLCSNPIPPTMKEGIDVGEPLSVGTSIRNDFDIAEMLQSVGDSLSGAAAQAGVDLVLYHGDDIGLRHVCVKGDENGISYALSHVVRQVLLVALPGDSIELGLLVWSLDPKSDEVNALFQSETETESSANPPPLSPDGPLSCTIRISHKYSADSPAIANKSTQRAAPTRTNPNFDYLLLHRLLRQIGATLNTDLPPPINFADGRTCDFTLMLDRGSLSLTNTPMVNDFRDEDPMAGEPTVDQLTFFAESLKGRRVTLYASPKGSFARHLIGSLTSWGMDVTHVSPDGAVDGLVNFENDPSEPRTPMATSESKTPGLPSNGAARSCAAMYFIFIDDDVEVLKERLHVLRAEHTLRKRPSLAAHHRPRSSPQIARSMGSTQSTPPPTSSVVVVHFTSLSNYKLIKDVVQSVVLSHAGSSIPLPEVMIIPKPAGPRRFLTALHTAVTKPTVDPFFVPIATSPTSPGVYHIGSFFRSYHNAQTGSPKTSTKSARPAGSRSNSDRSTKSSKDILDYVSHCPPSPLGMSDNVEYFSETATKLGSSPSSGLVIQSPDGQPAGIFFHPRSKTVRNPPTHSMERDKGQLFVPPEKRRSSASRLGPSARESPTTFSSLYAVAGAPKPTLEPVRKLPPPSTDDCLPPSQPVSSSPILSRKPTPTESPRKSPPSVPPPVENNMAAGRRATQRRSSQENYPSPSGAISQKAKATDGNIVPPISVLIVDDNPINQTILSTFMKKKMIKYDLASNGQEAVQKWRTGEFHLILMDIQMPVMDGIQATKEIRRLEQSNAVAGYPPITPSNEERVSPLRTPSDTSTDTKSSSSPYRSSVIIVALTASSLQSDRVAALAAGCNDFLTKPVSLVWLNNKIIEWGSIKALQMWADLRPEVINNLSTGQAKNVADRLHVPRDRPVSSARSAAGKSRTPPPTSSGLGAGTGLPVSSTPGLSVVLPTGSGMKPSSSSMYRSPDVASPAKFWQSMGIDEPTLPPSAETLNELAIDLAHGGRRGSASSVRTLKAKPETEYKQPLSIKEEEDASLKRGPTSLPPPSDVQPTG